MLRKNRLFTPGPTPLLPAAQLAMAAATMHHRTADFRALYRRVLDDLKVFIGTQNDVILLAASGTGAMEAAVANLTSPGDKVLVLSAGKFGERWRDLARAFACDVEVAGADYGQAIAPGSVSEQLTPQTRAVFLQSTESSTGVRHDVQAIAAAVRQAAPDALLVVDAITGLGTTAFDVDGWGLDVIIGGSQKALMIPPGLAYCAVSERAWQRMEQTRSPRYYFDLRRERKSAAQGESAYTPATALIAALGAALDYLRAAGEGDLVRGRELLIANAETCAAMTRAAAQALGLELFAARPAAALTALRAPQGMDAGDIVRAFRRGFDAVVAGGQGEMKGRIFRIAHLGFYDYLDTIGILGALEQVLARAVSPRRIEFGAGLRAAQAAYAEAAS